MSVIAAIGVAFCLLPRLTLLGSRQQVQVMTIAALDKDLVRTMPLMQTVANYLQHHQIDLKLLTKALN